MLSRTADHLFWMSRYTERAENTARMLSVSYDTAMLPLPEPQAQAMWQGVLSISELLDLYRARCGAVSKAQVLHFLVADDTHPASIRACLQAARENARAVRGALSTELWETHNQTWLAMQQHMQAGAWQQEPAQLLEWVKYRSHLARGVALGTMLQDEALNFLGLGTFLERADNTARLLDVRFHAVAPTAAVHDLRAHSAQGLGQPRDFYYWSALLRSVSALEVYRKVYRDVITPAKVVDLLVLRADMPRSLHACLHQFMENLAAIDPQSATSSSRHAGRLLADLQYVQAEDILEAGLHAYLTQFLARINHLGALIAQEYLGQTG